MEKKYTNEDLSIMKNWSLERKIQVTQTRIIEWYKQYDGKVYVSFSGGKDSTVLLDLARRIFPETEAVYIDTGLEYPEVRNFVKTIKNVRWLKPAMNFKQVIMKYGYPVVSKEQSQYIGQYRTAKSEKTKDTRWNGNKYGRGKISEKWKYLVNAPFKISDQCCNIMKKNPAKKYEKESGKYPIIGTMADESALRKSEWIKNGCNAFDKKRPTSKPMSFWTEQDVLLYISKFGLNYSEAYGEIVESDGKLRTTKCDRTGCVFCCYGCHAEKGENRFQRLKRTHNNLWNYCMKPIENGGLGMKDVLNFIGIEIE